MTLTEWEDSRLRAFGFRLCGEAMDEVDERGEAITDDTLLVLLNAHDRGVAFVAPDAHPGKRWEVLVDTAHESGVADVRFDAGAAIELAGRSLMLLGACV